MEIYEILNDAKFIDDQKNIILRNFNALLLLEPFWCVVNRSVCVCVCVCVCAHHLFSYVVLLCAKSSYILNWILVLGKVLYYGSKWFCTLQMVTFMVLLKSFPMSENLSYQILRGRISFPSIFYWFFFKKTPDFCNSSFSCSLHFLIPSRNNLMKNVIQRFAY